MGFPTRNNFDLRFGLALAGTRVRIDNDEIYEDIRTSRLLDTSNPVLVGQIFQYTANPPAIDDELRTEVTAVDGTFTADLFAGFLPNREFETRVRDIQNLHTTAREDNLNIGRVEPGDLVPRAVDAEARWIETPLAAGTVLTPADPVNVVAIVGEGGGVSNAGGTVVANLAFVGSVRTSSQTGRNYAPVQIRETLLV